MSHTTNDSVALVHLATDSPLALALQRAGRTTGEPATAGVVLVGGTDDLEETRQRLHAAAASAGPGALVALAGPFCSVTEAAAGLPDPSRVAGVHLHDTGPGRGTVEIIPGLLSAESVVDGLVELVDAMEGVVAVVVKDRPGRLLDALFVPYLNDVINELDDELATAEDLDVALTLGLGYQRGPLELLDEVGLDRHLRTTSALYEATHDVRYAPPALLRQMVAGGHRGTGSAGGFRATPAS